ncbi:MAG: hypothetical protein J0I77_09505 [Rudaea sp.]|uniref:hypothetical protein n=1 Tax=unclassified Rudaea TaxID=2627037 RepID=UPI0010F83CD3|nr:MULTISPECIES: hypothetical protein [unclassified Rudaea]MBN8885943.1 hypothetical protein [Rudaea sp.]MBR0347053.1 hypothetical protein [Rudaea sp.]
MSTTIEEIESAAKVYAGARDELAERVNILREEHEAAKRRRLQGIKNSLERTREAYEVLKAAVIDGRGLFDKPKTRILHGIKVGWQKQKGELQIADEKVTIAALRKLFGEEQAAAYIKTTDKPIKSALQTLSAAELKKCSIAVTNDGEAVLIKAQDSEIDKMVDALLGNAEEGESDS